MSKEISILPGCTCFIGDAEPLLQKLLPGKKVYVVTDRNVRRAHPSLFGSFPVFEIEPGERSKTLSTVGEIYRFLVDGEADRNSFVLGVGGGIVTDMAGFAAGTFMRGIDFGFVSTTLLGQVDASVGGKNGVNFDSFKNMVGTFRQPRFIISDPSLLCSLPQREFNSGMAEVIKAAVIGSASLFSRLETADPSELRNDLTAVGEMVSDAVAVKARIVREDEKEGGLRRVLNLGHTVAHAIEKRGQEYSHGEAVAIGLAAVSEISVNMGMMSRPEADRIRLLCERFSLPVTLPCGAGELMEGIRKDKKRNDGTLHLILPVRIGEVKDVEMELSKIETALKQI